MRYYIIAGEKSGDMHGGKLMQAIKQEDLNAEFRFWGGACMQQVGGALVVPYTEVAFMGLDFLSSLRKLYQYLRYCQQDILAFQPDVLILIDYAGFNLRIAKFAKKHLIKTFYYISPKIWAWNTSRINQIKAYVDRMFVILPFEKAFYKKYDYPVDYVGNPLIEQISLHTPYPHFRSTYHLDQRPIIALLPGSRIGEIKRILPTMLSIVSSLPEYQFVLAALSELPVGLYEQAHKTQNVQVAYDQVYNVLTNAYAAIVTSGTATLEAACFQVPQIVVYKTGLFSYTFAKWLVRLKHISLVNIIAGQDVVQELIQDRFTSTNLLQALQDLLNNANARQAQLVGYSNILQLLGKKKASQTAAKLIVSYLNSPKN
jgi:lipid-A-disaccharide synthase